MGARGFDLGCCTATPGALLACAEAGESVARLIARHAGGDWGDLCAEDAALNEAAVGDGGRILSAYPLAGGTKLYVVTEADRSFTTALLADEY
jgi:hypothetical protein